MSSTNNRVSRPRPLPTPSALAVLFGLGLAAGSAAADVSLELRAVEDIVEFGDDVFVGLYAVSDTPGVDHPISAIEAVIEWDPTILALVGLDGTGGSPLIFSGFPTTGSGGLNESLIPQDGDLFYLALGQLGNPIDATPAGTLITTFQFEAVSSGPDSLIIIQPQGGSPPVETVVYDGTVPNTDVTGTLGSESISVRCGVADLAEPYGLLDFSDVIAFLTFFDAMDPAADLEVPIGSFDFSDVIAFLIAFAEGCP